jgi:hypothetical protein
MEKIQKMCSRHGAGAGECDAHPRWSRFQIVEKVRCIGSSSDEHFNFLGCIENDRFNYPDQTAYLDSESVAIILVSSREQRASHKYWVHRKCRMPI